MLALELRGHQPKIVIPGWSEGPDLRCAIAHRGISRFSDVQLHIVVRCSASPRNDGNQLTKHRQRDHIIGMPDAALEHGVLELELETARRSDAALGGKRAAEHDAAVRQSLAAKAARNEV